MTSSGGNLSLDLQFEGKLSKQEKESALAEGLRACYEFMKDKGYIPPHARLMSSRNIAEHYGKTRQYWEKLLNQGKILYKETAAGRITTDLWVEGYLGDKEKVDEYVRGVRTVLERIDSAGRRDGLVICPICDKERFSFFVNVGSNTNGVCRSCGFHVHTLSEPK